MNRKLILGERIMYVDAQAMVNCVFTAKIRGSISPERLEIALGKLQLKHPLLRVVIREDDKGNPYFVSDTQISPIPVHIIHRTSDTDWQAISAVEWSNPFNAGQGPLARVVWLRSATVSELLLVCPHCICDGTSILTLMRELLQVLDKPETLLTPYHSFESIRSFIPADLLSNTTLRMKAWLVSKVARGILSLKTPRKKASPGKHYMVHWKMDTTATSSLISLCKTENTSPHAAFSVAFLEAYQAIMGDQAHGKVICPVDIRRFIPALKQEHMFAFAPIAELSIAKTQEVDFWTKARQLKNDLTTAIGKMDIHKLLLMSEYFHSSASRMISYLKNTAGTHDVTLSNMGKLDIPDQYDTFDLETIYSPSAAFPWRNANTLVVSTFKGQTDFSFISQDVFLEERHARAVAHKMQELLSGKEAVLQVH